MYCKNGSHTKTFTYIIKTNFDGSNSYKVNNPSETNKILQDQYKESSASSTVSNKCTRKCSWWKCWRN